jgi:hypothetical protein
MPKDGRSKHQQEQRVDEFEERLLTEGSRNFVAQFGAEVRAIVSGQFRNAIGERPTSSLQLRATDPPVDFAQPVQVFPDSTNDPIISGLTVTASTKESRIAVEVEGAREMVETLIAKTVSWGLDAKEMFHTVARGAGLDESRIKIEDYDPPGYQPFLVQVPIEKFKVTRRIDVGPVWFESTESTPNLDATIDAFARIDESEIATVASVIVTERFVLDAESLGLNRVEDALAAMAAATLFSQSKRPDGLALTFNRDQLLARPTARNAAFVIGRIDRRGWVRSTERSSVLNALDAVLLNRNWPLLRLPHPPRHVLLAAAALRSAADHNRTLSERNQILWNAVEFYVSTAKVPRLVNTEDRKALKHAVRNSGASSTSVERAVQLIGKVNDPPLMTKLLHCADRDEVPFSDEERALLKSLRLNRNHLAHGRNSETLESELDQAVSVVARFVMFHWHSWATTVGQAEGWTLPSESEF